MIESGTMSHSIADDLSSLGNPEELRLGEEEAPEAGEPEELQRGVEFEMVVNGFRCPDEYCAVLTPMEFEEMVRMFMEYDADGSKTIDKVRLFFESANLT